MTELGRFLTFAGLAIAGLGLLLWTGVGRGWLGQLPGDIRVSRDGFSFHFPIVTCLVLSAVVSLVAWLVRK